MSHRKPDQDLDEIARRVLLLARNRHGKLAGITVGVCDDLDPAACQKELRERLSRAGYPEVDVDIVPGARGACAELLSLDFRW